MDKFAEYSLPKLQRTEITGEDGNTINPSQGMNINTTLNNHFISMRAEGLTALHHLQIDLLKKWRNHKKSGREEEAEAMLPELLLTVNAIASGLRSTG